MPALLKRYAPWLAVSGLVCILIALSSRSVGIVSFDPDPWIAIYGARRILEGQLLYKDFFDFVTPGTDYLLAGVFRVFGFKLAAAQWAVIISNALVVVAISVVSFSLIRSVWMALLPGLLFALYAPYAFYVSHHWFVSVPVILALASQGSQLSHNNRQNHIPGLLPAWP